MSKKIDPQTEKKQKVAAKKLGSNSMPHSLEAEQSLLGSVLMDKDAAGDILPALAAHDFYSESHKYIAEVMKKIFAAGQTVDFVTVTDELDRNGLMEAVGGIDYITHLSNSFLSSANWRQYLDIVKRDSIFRQLIGGSGRIAEFTYSAEDAREALAHAEKLIYDIGDKNSVNNLVTISDTLVEVIDRFEAVHKDKDAFKGLPTGFTHLDYLTNGLHGGDFVVVAARPGEGKTSLMLNMAEHAALFGNAKVAIFSLEMARQQLVQRMLCSVANVPMVDAVRGNLDRNGSGEQWLKIMEANSLLYKTNIYIDDNSMITPPEILSKCRRLKQKYGLDLIVIDYIQLMESGKKRDNRQQEVSEITRALKIIAKELNVPVLTASQLNRDAENKRPQLSNLRESGAIEQDADIVMFIYHPSKALDANGNKNDAAIGTVELILEKHRNGPTGTVFLTWKGESTRFFNQDKYSQDLSREYQKNQENKAKPKKSEPSYDNPPDFEEAFSNTPLPNEAPPTE